MAKEYKENVLTNVNDEYFKYLLSEVKKSPQEILNDSPKNNFYMIIHDLICDDDGLTEGDYKKLHSKGDKVISTLYDSYTSNEGAHIAVQDCFFGILTDFIDNQLSSGHYM